MIREQLTKGFSHDSGVQVLTFCSAKHGQPTLKMEVAIVILTVLQVIFAFDPIYNGQDRTLQEPNGYNNTYNESNNSNNATREEDSQNTMQGE